MPKLKYFLKITSFCLFFSAFAFNAFAADVYVDVANTGAEESVLIVPSPIFNAATIIGKVFKDSNKNGYQDEGEEGLPNISLITEDGFLATTDKYGRYHIEGLKPQTKVVAVMTNTLPSNSTLTTENPVLLRFSVALTMKANFGVYIEEEE